MIIIRENGTKWTRATEANNKQEAIKYVVGKLNWRHQAAITEGESKVEALEI